MVIKVVWYYTCTVEPLWESTSVIFVCSGWPLITTAVFIYFTDQLAVTISPSNLLIGKGTTAQFTAIATGISTTENNFMYQWRKRDSASLPNKVSGVNREVLTILNTFESDEGQYYCIVTNEWGRSVESNNVTLAIFGML